MRVGKRFALLAVGLVAIPANSSRLVPAVSELRPGTYRFYCRQHPNMRGTLTVMGHAANPPQDALTFEQRRTIPPVLTGRRIVLRAERTFERVLPHGPLTPMWTFGGSYPGPTIVRPAGHDTKVLVVNRVPPKAGMLTLHLHGDHHASAHDGQPDDFPLREAGRPERAAFDWYTTTAWTAPDATSGAVHKACSS